MAGSTWTAGRDGDGIAGGTQQGPSFRIAPAACRNSAKPPAKATLASHWVRLCRSLYRSLGRDATTRALSHTLTILYSPASRQACDMQMLSAKPPVPTTSFVISETRAEVSRSPPAMQAAACHRSKLPTRSLRHISPLWVHLPKALRCAVPPMPVVIEPRNYGTGTAFVTTGTTWHALGR